MSKELIEVKNDSLKAKLKYTLLIFFIIIGGICLSCGIFYYYLNNNKENVDENSYSVENIELVKENQNEIVEEKKEDEIRNSNELEKPNLEEIFKQEFLENFNKEENCNKNIPEWTNTAIQDIKDIYSSSEKQVYLTFDDGPSKEVTPSILQILKEEDVPATFFVLGKCVVQNPELVKQEYEEGHFIANHGYTHTYSQIYSSVDNVYNEYLRANEAIKSAIGNSEYDCHLFRFPGGSSGGPYDALKAEAKQFLANNNIASTNWNCLTSDAAGNNTVESQFQGALDTQAGKTSLIILMHDASDKKYTPETLKLLIKHYKEEGYVFKNFYEIFRNKNIEENEINIEKNQN